MASWVTSVPVSTTTPCVVVTPMSTSLLMLSAANWDFSSVVIRLSEPAGSLLVAPSWASVAVVLAVSTVVVLGYDGETNWFEGALLLGLYAILAIAFFYIPTAAAAH